MFKTKISKIILFLLIGIEIYLFLKPVTELYTIGSKISGIITVFFGLIAIAALLGGKSNKKDDDSYDTRA